MANIGGYSKESLLSQAQNVWTMLDEMAEDSPEKYKEFMEKQRQEAKEYMKPPVPNMCIQTMLQVTCQSTLQVITGDLSKYITGNYRWFGKVHYR